MMYWNVFNYSHNKGEMITFNVFDHYRFGNYVRELCARDVTFEEFERQLRTDVRYCFWCKYEYETWIMQYNGDEEKGKRIDVHDQIALNWDRFVEYVWAHKNETNGLPNWDEHF